MTVPVHVSVWALVSNSFGYASRSRTAGPHGFMVIEEPLKSFPVTEWIILHSNQQWMKVPNSLLSHQHLLFSFFKSLGLFFFFFLVIACLSSSYHPQPLNRAWSKRKEILLLKGRSTNKNKDSTLRAIQLLVIILTITVLVSREPRN
jgi:hypothetical protein